jgi:hypothetical protein
VTGNDTKFPMHLQAALGAALPRNQIRLFWRALSERERVPQPPDEANLAGDPKGNGRAELVLGPFAGTKGPRHAGAKPR